MASQQFRFTAKYHRIIVLFLLAIALAVMTHATQAAPTSTIIVTDSSDAATCPSALTLRCAINFANGHPFTTINFDASVVAVLLQNPLPVITGNGTWIDGTSIVPRIDGAFWSGAAGNALAIIADNVTISNIKIVNIPAGAADIRIQGGKNAKIIYDYLGILPGATHCTTDTDYGVLLDSNAAGTSGDNNGVAYIFGNTISCHASRGIWDYFANYVGVGVDGVGNVIGNNIGTTADGAQAAGNGLGIEVEGDHLSIRGNLIAYNTGAGLRLAFGASNNDVTSNTLTHNGGPGIWIGSGSSNRLLANDIGTNAGGVAVLSNGAEGILISDGSGVFLSDNLVAYNHAAGIAITGNSTHVLIENNNIYRNGGLPIDLGNDGATINGSQESVGPNDWLQYPVVTAFSGSLVQGSTCPSCAVYIYKAIGNPAALGGGGLFQTNVWANSSGQWSASLPNGLTRLDVTFTTFDAGGNSSEMSPRPQTFLPLIIRH